MSSSPLKPLRVPRLFLKSKNCAVSLYDELKQSDKKGNNGLPKYLLFLSNIGAILIKKPTTLDKKIY